MLTKEQDDREWDAASDKQQDLQDRELERTEEVKARLIAMGYNLDHLDKDNPYLQY